MLNVLRPEEGIIQATNQYMYHSLYRELLLRDSFASLDVFSLMCLVDSLVFFCLLKLEVFIYHGGGGGAHVVYTPHLI